MGLKEEIKEKAKEVGFAMCGVSDLKKIEKAEFPNGRGLVRPSMIMPEAKSLIVIGYVIWDEALNVEVLKANSSEYICLYYEIMESRAWRLSHWLWEKKSIKALPSQAIHIKPAAMLAGLGFIGHNTQVITPKYGANVRWVAVLIDTELEVDKPFTRDLCAEQQVCQKKSLCVLACPYRAIIPGPSQGVPQGEKVKYDRCIETHTRDEVLDKIWEKFIRRISDQGFMACTRCSLACPYGKPVV
jgi:epoxyqueuosine reductase